ncbi:MAG: hypothetical protein AAF219_00840 [Myxococcota bacterium]
MQKRCALFANLCYATSMVQSARPERAAVASIPVSSTTELAPACHSAEARSLNSTSAAGLDATEPYLAKTIIDRASAVGSSPPSVADLRRIYSRMRCEPLRRGELEATARHLAHRWRGALRPLLELRGVDQGSLFGTQRQITEHIVELAKRRQMVFSPSARVLPFGFRPSDPTDLPDHRRRGFLARTDLNIDGQPYSFAIGREPVLEGDTHWQLFRPYVYLDHGICSLVSELAPTLFRRFQSMASLCTHDLTVHGTIHHTGVNSPMMDIWLLQLRDPPRDVAPVSGIELYSARLHRILWASLLKSDRRRAAFVRQIERFCSQTSRLAKALPRSAGVGPVELERYLTRAYFEKNVFFVLDPDGADIAPYRERYPWLQVGKFQKEIHRADTQLFSDDERSVAEIAGLYMNAFETHGMVF